MRAVRGVGGTADEEPANLGGHTFLTSSGTRIRGHLVEWTEGGRLISETPNGDGSADVIVVAPSEGVEGRLFLQLIVRQK